MTRPLTPESEALHGQYHSNSVNRARCRRTPDDREGCWFYNGLAAIEAAAIARDREGLVEACICEHPLVHHDPSGRCHGTHGITQMYCSCQAFRTPEQARRLLGVTDEH
jgi:hypothetical protein